MNVALALALAALALSCPAPAASKWSPPRRHHRHTQREEVLDAAAGVVRDDLPEAQFFTNSLDHFDAQDNRTYQQRFYVNDTFFSAALARDPSSAPPVFLYVDGEGAASPYDAVHGHHMEMAATHGALVIAVEHRYYGASVPTPTLTTDDLQWLSSQQALADLAAFRAYADRRWSLTARNTWISFGGSYPGALSAWLRLKYPHVVYAAVASSAPVLAKLNFEGYNEVLSSALATPLVGGCPGCLANVNAAFSQVSAMLADGSTGRSKLSKLFNTCAPLGGASDGDVATFVAALSGAFQGVVQYNDEIPGRPSVRSLCATMGNSTSGRGADPLSALAAVVADQAGGDCVDISYDDSMAVLRNTTVDRSSTGVGDRQWIYQSCTQFSFWQTCDGNTTCPWHTDTQSLASNLDLCSELFGEAGARVAELTDFTNDYYGGLDLQATRVLMVDGSIDPWHVLSILEGVPGNQGVDSLFIRGTAHCANMMSSRPDDPPYLRVARAEIETKVAAWLAEAAVSGH